MCRTLPWIAFLSLLDLPESRMRNIMFDLSPIYGDGAKLGTVNSWFMMATPEDVRLFWVGSRARGAIIW